MSCARTVRRTAVTRQHYDAPFHVERPADQPRTRRRGRSASSQPVKDSSSRTLTAFVTVVDRLTCEAPWCTWSLIDAEHLTRRCSLPAKPLVNIGSRVRSARSWRGAPDRHSIQTLRQLMCAPVAYVCVRTNRTVTDVSRETLTPRRRRHGAVDVMRSIAACVPSTTLVARHTARSRGRRTHGFTSQGNNTRMPTAPSHPPSYPPRHPSSHPPSHRRHARTTERSGNARHARHARGARPPPLIDAPWATRVRACDIRNDTARAQRARGHVPRSTSETSRGTRPRHHPARPSTVSVILKLGKLILWPGIILRFLRSDSRW